MKVLVALIAIALLFKIFCLIAETWCLNRIVQDWFSYPKAPLV